ncbi:dihydroorotase [Alloscardovia theropitheci]|uniref:Dihydroorotase n=1 Tax=Alloscardovia theropitheci TaxID=2496842 RepID=A0A4R0QQY2_9BIFI|nr:dihydroorotase [Alloscardovia theropitheci]TCD54752.1 dihydroorotase [Alloscardovia theropitheci]
MTVVLNDIRIWDTQEHITVRIPDGNEDELILDASAWQIAPGFADPHVHFRDPGQTDKETMESGALAAAHGGYTNVLIMPNTIPALDGISYDGVNALEELENRHNLPVRYALCASASKERNGEKPSEYDDWKDALRGGAAGYKHPVIAVSDDGSAVTNSTLDTVVRNCIQANIPFIDHCEHHTTGVMNEGAISRKLCLPGIPAETELNIVERDIQKCRATGVHLHLQHVSTAAAFEAVRQAKSEGINITCETAPHYLALDDSAVEEYGTYAKMNPPLRSAADRLATLEAVCDGTVDLIATDHAPHTVEEKAAGSLDAMMSAPNGIIGLETAYPVLRHVLVETGYIDDARLIELLSVEPNRLMGAQSFDIADFAHSHDGIIDFDSADIHMMKTPELSQTDIEGEHPDVVILAPDESWTIDSSEFASQARNTPFNGWDVRGRVVATICNGELTYSRFDSYSD